MIRLLHVSDLHVQDPIWAMPLRGLLGKRLVGAANLWLRRERLFRAAPSKLSGLGDFVRAQAIDAVLCTGDFTALGTEGEHTAARAMISGLGAAPHGLLVVPGNHDLYLQDALEDARFERHFGDLLRSDRPEQAREGAYPFVRLLGDAAVIVGINSARPNPWPFESSGVVPACQLDGLARILDEYADRLCIVMTHYAPLNKAGRPDSVHHGLRNGQSLLAVCARPNVMLIHGHIHQRYHHPACMGRPWLFCAGSATHEGREGLWVYELGDRRVRAVPGTWGGVAYTLIEAQAVSFEWSAATR